MMVLAAGQILIVTAENRVRTRLRAGAKRIRTGGPFWDRPGFSGGIGDKGGLGDLVSLTWDVGFESALLQRRVKREVKRLAIHYSPRPHR